jgi:hypothetical protein
MKNGLTIAFLLFAGCLNAGNNLKVFSDFPGGNIVVTRISGDTVWVKPDLSFTAGEWFYWYFKVSGVSGKTVNFKFDQNNVFAKYGPAYSINNDENWKWYGENRVVDNGFSFTFSQRDTVGFFSIGFPYTEKDLNKFLKSLPNGECLIVDTLCLSPENRMIEKIIIPSAEKTPKYRVLITVRHHACEMMASYVLEGIIKSVLNNRNTEWLRRKVEFMIVPFMDKDGVENGEQGKNRIPRDHNRDYSGEAIHRSTAALRTIIPVWSDNKLKIALDMHCPWISGEHEEHIYSAGSSDPEEEQQQILFSQLLEKNSTGELKLYHKNFLPYGKSWNTDKNYSQGMGFREWASSIEGVSLASSIEFPYANISGLMVTKDNARFFGEAIACSIEEYLEALGL